MSCYYRIELPGGDFIRIPSKVNLISSDQNTKEVIDEYYSDPKLEDFNLAYKEVAKAKFLKDLDFEEINENFRTQYETQLNNVTELRDYLINFYDLGGISKSTLDKFIRESNVENLITNINDYIKKSATPENFEEAIKRWAYFDLSKKTKKGKEIFPGSLEEFLRMINRTVKPIYFKELDYLNIVGKTTITNEINNLNTKIDDLQSIYGMSTALQKDIKTVLNGFKDLGLEKAEILFGISRTGNENDTLIIPPSTNSQGFIFYNKGNELSLFLGIFKYIASSVDWSDANSAKLKQIIDEWNKSAEEKIDLRNFSGKRFFAGEFKGSEDKINTFIDGKFHKIIKEFSYPTISKIIDLVYDLSNVDKKEALKLATKKTFKWIDPNKYGNALFTSQVLASSEYDTEALKNQALRNELIAQEYGQYNTAKRNFYYAPLETISITGPNSIQTAYLKLKSKVELGKDLIRITLKEKTKKVTTKLTKEKIEIEKNEYLYLIPTRLWTTDEGIGIVGVVKENGQTVEKKYFIKATAVGTDDESILINYRKFETGEEPYITDAPGKLTEAYLIKSRTGELLSRQIVKRFAEVGSFVTYKNKKGEERHSTVSGVYPGNLSVIGEAFPLSYDQIIEINSTKFTEEDLKSWRDFDDKSRLSLSGDAAQKLPTAGDIVKFKDKGITRINKVIDIDPGHVYILVKTKDSFYVEKIPRTQITNALVNFDPIAITDELVTAAYELDAIRAENKSIRNFKYSYSENLEEAKNGDILVSIGDTPSENKYFKLIEKETMKVVNRTGLSSTDYEVQILTPSDVQGFLTTRNISGMFALDIARINNRVIVDTSDTNADMGIAYVIPKGMSIEHATLFDSLWFNIGEVIDKEYLGTGKYADFDDVTETALKLISRKLNKVVKSLNFQVVETTPKGNKIYKKAIDDLQEIPYFNKLSKDEKMNAFQLNSYVKLYREELGNKTYLISEDLNKNVILEYSVFGNDGRLRTIRKLMSKDELADRVTRFYLIKGNSKIASLMKKSITIKKDDQRTKEDIRLAFINNIKGVFKELNLDINVRLVSAKQGGFITTDETNQKAKIQNGEILINKTESSEEDVVHEFLHVFLIGLKYQAPSKYSSLLLDFWRTKIQNNPDMPTIYGIDPQTIDNLDKMEEVFVKVLSKLLVEQDSLDFSSIISIEDALVTSIEALGLDTSNFESVNLYGILTTPIRDLLGVTSKTKLFTDLLVYEANFREWVAENVSNKNLEINCN